LRDTGLVDGWRLVPVSAPPFLLKDAGCPLSDYGIGSQVDRPTLAPAIYTWQFIANPTEGYTGTILPSAEVGARRYRLQIVQPNQG